MKKEDELLSSSDSFLNSNYQATTFFFGASGIKSVIFKDQTLRCRFCFRQPPDTAFKKRAHTLPESTGNNTLFSRFECDNCNLYFGKTIENDFGNWTALLRTLGHVVGKSGPVRIKKNDYSIRSQNPGNLNITAEEGQVSVYVDEKNKLLNITSVIDPYTPLAVLKCFCKMAISLVPEENFEDYLNVAHWVREPDHNIHFGSIYPNVYSTMFCRPSPLEESSATLLIRKSDDLLLPQTTFILAFGIVMYQIWLPQLAVKDSSLPNPWRLALDNNPAYESESSIISLSSSEKIRGDSACVKFKFESHPITLDE